MIKASLIITLLLFSTCSFALEKYKGVADGSDSSLTSTCKQYMNSSLLTGNSELFFYLLPNTEAVKNLEDKIRANWHKKQEERFGYPPVKSYETLVFKDEIKLGGSKNNPIKYIRFKYKTALMERMKYSFCAFKQEEGKRWHLNQIP